MISRIRRLILALTLGTVFLFLMALLIALPVKAGDVTVFNTNDSGAGSLRQAIADAIDGDTILFDSSLEGQTISLTSGELLITKKLTISGPGANLLAISGNNLSRVIHIAATVTINGVTIKEGTAPDGGGIFNNGGSVTLTNSTIASNTATATGGGGIVNFGGGSVALTNSTVASNTAPTGGGIFNQEGSITLANSTVASNTASTNGGGIYNVLDGSVTLTNSTIASNTASTNGGGIFSIGLGNSITVTNSTVADNTGATNGGGIYNSNGSVALTNSTVTGNTGVTIGGGILNNGGSVTLTNSTVASNTAPTGGGIFNQGGSITLANSIAANSLNSGNDCTGTITSQGFNLDSDNTCNLTATGDITSTNPLLGPLQDNGGATLTHALLDGSPAIDHIPNGTNGCGATITSDQRGAVRPHGPRCDIGAYEVSSNLNLYLPLIFKS